MKVVKFGGSSLACKESILKARDIVLEDIERRFVVVSAPGKCKEFPRKVTDLLIDAQAELSADDCNGWECSESLNAVVARFKKLSKDVGVDILDEIKRTHEEICINCQDRDFVISRGEYLMAILFARVLGFGFIDAASLIVVMQNGKFHEANTKANFLRRASRGNRTVMPGFFGTSINGGVKTFARGGSDYSVAIAAVCLNASMCEIFTDTYGVQTANPTLVKSTKTVAELDFATMHKLSVGGASVLHPDSLPLLRSHAVTLKVDNTFDHGVHYTFVTTVGGVGKYFCITYRFEQNINKDMVEILCVFNKLSFELSELRKLLAGVEVYLVGFKKREVTLIAPTVNLSVVINQLHEYLIGALEVNGVLVK
jgi:aspartate kinase